MFKKWRLKKVLAEEEKVNQRLLALYGSIWDEPDHEKK